ncbi:hypothetical protein Alg130_10101 [Pyrenophora tritici-repentis]|nr:hypothetical protein Alg130_10101 [Pyrenophora tritici-repentis]
MAFDFEENRRLDCFDKELKSLDESPFRASDPEGRELDYFLCIGHGFLYNVDGYNFCNLERLPLSLEDTGIPELKRFIISVSADKKIKSLLRHVRHGLPVQINRVKKGCVHRHAQVLLNIDWDEQQEACLKDVERRVDAYFDNPVFPQLIDKIEDYLPRWKAKAADECKKWANMYQTTFQVYIRKHDAHKPPSRIGKSWNGDLLAPVEKGLSPRFVATEKQTGGHLEEITRSIKYRMDTISLLVPKRLSTFSNTVDQVKKDIDKLVTKYTWDVITSSTIKPKYAIRTKPIRTSTLPLVEYTMQPSSSDQPAPRLRDAYKPNSLDEI